MKNKANLLLLCFSGLIFINQTVRAENLGDMLSDYIPGNTAFDSAWSVFVGGDFTVNPGAVELEGRAFVRNDLKVLSPIGYNVGVAIGSGVHPPTNSESLVVGNNLFGNQTLKMGGRSVRVENTVTSDVSFIDLGNLYTGGVDLSAADQLISDLQQKSAYWGSLSSTPGGTISSDDGGWVVDVTADGVNGNPKVWVFNTDLVPFARDKHVINFVGFEPGDTILINVDKTGADDEFIFAPSAFHVNGVIADAATLSFFKSQLLWNFPDAAELELTCCSIFAGAILIANPNSTTTVTMPGHDGRFVTCGDLIHSGLDGVGGREFHNYPFKGDLPDLPVELFGYLFIDNNNDQIRNSGDTTITNALVELSVDGVSVATTNTNNEGYYYFAEVPVGVATVQVVQAGATLVAVPAIPDPMRNRAVSNAVDTAVIHHSVTSGYGVLASNPGEPLNFGYESHPLSTQIDLRAYSAADGKVMIEISTVNENGNNDIEIYAMINDAWTLVSTVPSELLEGIGSNNYTVEAFGLTAGESYFFKIVDESGHIFESGLIEVARSLVKVRSVTLTPKRFKITFASDPEMTYQVMVCEELGAPWKLEYVWHPTVNGWSEEPGNEPFNAAPGDKTEVLVPRNRAKAFFKVIQAQ